MHHGKIKSTVQTISEFSSVHFSIFFTYLLFSWVFKSLSAIAMSVLFTIMIVSLQFLSVSLFSAVLQLTSLVLHVSRWAVVVRVAVEMIDESGHPADRSVVPVRTVDYWGRRRCRRHTRRRDRSTVLRFAPFPH